MLFLQHVIDALSVGSIDSLYALGMALIFGIMRLLNFAHGELIMVGGYGLYEFAGLPAGVAVALVILLVVVLALLMERIAFRPVRGADPSTLLITSFAVSYLLQNLASLIYTSTPRGIAFGAALNEPVAVGSLRITKLSIITVVLTILLISAVGIFLQKTRLGIQMRAAAENFAIARLVGVRANVVIPAAFVMSGVLAAVAGILLISQSGTISNGIGLSPVLVGVVATVVGGLGGLVGPVLAGFLLGVVTVVLEIVLPDGASPFRDALLYTLVILVLLLRPQGLLAPKSIVQRI